MQPGNSSAREEWREHWPLVLAAFVGISFSAVAVYSIGFFIEPLGSEFGWSRTEVSVGLSIFALITVPLAPVVGAIIDRWGARRMAIAGIILTASAFAGFGLATGSLRVWVGQWILFSLFALGLKATVWTVAISRAFHHGRGMALAVALCGTAMTQILAPLLSNWLITEFGWRQAYFMLGGGWGGAAFILLLLFFFDGPERARASPHRQTEGSIGADALGGLSFSDADSDDRDQPFRDDGDQRSEMIAISGGHPVDGELVSVLDVGVNLDAGVGAPQAIAFEFDAMGVVNEAVQDRIGVSGVGYGVMP